MHQPHTGARTSSALGAVLFLLLALPAAGAPFKRPSWADFDHDCKDTRAEVLAARCPLVTWNEKGCAVVQATCRDLYSGAEISTDTASSSLQVDHLYPASQAWKVGTWLDKDGKRCASPTRCASFKAFFNDELNLVVTRSRTNGQKNDDLADGWCAALPGARKWAATRYRAVAAKYNLPITPAEEAGLQAWARGECPRGARLL